MRTGAPALTLAVAAVASTLARARQVSAAQLLVSGLLAVVLLTALGAGPAWTDVTERVSVASDGTQGDGFSFSSALSADGRFVAFVSGATNLVPGDTNGVTDIFVHDRQTGTTERVSARRVRGLGQRPGRPREGEGVLAAALGGVHRRVGGSGEA